MSFLVDVIPVFPTSNPLADSSAVAPPERFLTEMLLAQGNSSTNLLPKTQSEEENPCSRWDGGGCTLC